MNPTRVLVTGGVGFIGTHVVEELRATGHEVRVVDALHPAADVGPPAALHPDVEYLWGDLADPEVARRAVAGVDSVCHQAAMVGLGVDFRDVARVRASQRPRRPRNCSPHCTHAPSPVGSSSRAAWSSTAKAGIAVGSTVWSRRRRASRRTSTRVGSNHRVLNVANQ